MSPYLGPVTTEITRAGGHVDEYWQGRHTRLRWSCNGRKYTETLALSPRTERSLKDALAQIRRRARQAREPREVREDGLSMTYSAENYDLLLKESVN
jgi:hypothetical protein